MSTKETIVIPCETGDNSEEKLQNTPSGLSRDNERYYIDEIQQAEFWRYYFNKKDRKTYGNAYRSALKAGYADSTAKVITRRPFFFNYVMEIRRRQLVKKATSKITEILDADLKNGLDRVDVNLARVQLDGAKFIAERLDDRFKQKTEIDLTSGGEKIEAIRYIAPELKQVIDVTPDNTEQDLSSPSSNI